jgi:hypothetical protein
MSYNKQQQLTVREENIKKREIELIRYHYFLNNLNEQILIDKEYLKKYENELKKYHYKLNIESDILNLSKSIIARHSIEDYNKWLSNDDINMNMNINITQYYKNLLLEKDKIINSLKQKK